MKFPHHNGGRFKFPLKRWASRRLLAKLCKCKSLMCLVTRVLDVYLLIGHVTPLLLRLYLVTTFIRTFLLRDNDVLAHIYTHDRTLTERVKVILASV
jgi:hypothetical protein